MLNGIFHVLLIQWGNTLHIQIYLSWSPIREKPPVSQTFGWLNQVCLPMNYSQGAFIITIIDIFDISTIPLWKIKIIFFIHSVLKLGVLFQRHASAHQFNYIKSFGIWMALWLWIKIIMPQIKFGNRISQKGMYQALKIHLTKQIFGDGRALGHLNTKNLYAWTVYHRSNVQWETFYWSPGRVLMISESPEGIITRSIRMIISFMQTRLNARKKICCTWINNAEAWHTEILATSCSQINIVWKHTRKYFIL